METIFSWYTEICAFSQPLFPTEFSNSGQVVYIYYEYRQKHNKKMRRAEF